MQGSDKTSASFALLEGTTKAAPQGVGSRRRKKKNKGRRNEDAALIEALTGPDPDALERAKERAERREARKQARKAEEKKRQEERRRQAAGQETAQSSHLGATPDASGSAATGGAETPSTNLTASLEKMLTAPSALSSQQQGPVRTTRGPSDGAKSLGAGTAHRLAQDLTTGEPSSAPSQAGPARAMRDPSTGSDFGFGGLVRALGNFEEPSSRADAGQGLSPEGLLPERCLTGEDGSAAAVEAREEPAASSATPAAPWLDVFRRNTEAGTSNPQLPEEPAS